MKMILRNVLPVAASCLSLVALSGCGDIDSTSSGEKIQIQLPMHSNQFSRLQTAGVPTYTNDIKSILDGACVMCHSSYADYAGAFAGKDGIRQTVDDKSMPPSYSDGMSDADRELVKAWVDGGAPE